MVNKIKVAGRLDFLGSDFSVALGTDGTDTFDQVGTGAVQVSGDQTIPTSSTALNIGSLSYPLYVLLINEDPDNYTEIANDAANANNFATVLPAGGKFGPAYVTAALYLKAHTGSCNIRRLFIKP